jgi:malate dehydrogenase (oxaloacetate-decarboxylating)
MFDLHSTALTYSAQPKLSTTLLSPMENKADLALAYTPGIAEVCELIQVDESAMFTHTFRRNNLAVISDGSAVLGLGNIGHKASYPVMEGKAMLFKRFADIDAIPIVISTQDPDEFITTVERIADSFGAINLEDIAAPHCFMIERTLQERLEIPLMHDDQHGTAVVVLAAVLNAMQITHRNNRQDIKIVVSGAGAAATGIVRLLIDSGFQQLVVVDSHGIIDAGRTNLNGAKQWFVEHTNPDHLTGNLQRALEGADIFIGVSKGNLISSADVALMAPNSIVIAMANPIPEIMPEDALAGGAAVTATGRSDLPNQVNNALAFPGIFRGAMNARQKISRQMLMSAAEAIREYHQPSLSEDNLMPSILDDQLHDAVARRVAAVS